MSTRRITGLPVPALPKEAPEELSILHAALKKELAEGEPEKACKILQEYFDYLTRFYAALCLDATRVLEVGHPGLEEMGATAQSFEDFEVLLKKSLEALGAKATHTLAKALRSVFFVGSTRQDPTPRRHSRLLQLAGIPIRGYRLMAEWCALEPGVGDLQGSGKCSREMRRYLPILKEWLTAAANFFRDSVHTGGILPDGETLQLSVALEGESLSTDGLLKVPSWLGDEVANLPTRGLVTSAPTPTAEPLSPQPEAQDDTEQPPEPEPTPDEPEIASEPEPTPDEPEDAPESEPIPEEPEVASEPEPTPEEPEVASEPEPTPDEPEVASKPEPTPEESEVASEPEPPPEEPAEVASEPEPTPEKEPETEADAGVKPEPKDERPTTGESEDDSEAWAVMLEKVTQEQSKVADEPPPVPEPEVVAEQPEPAPPPPAPVPVGPKPDDPVLAALWAVDTGQKIEDVEPEIPDTFEPVHVDGDYPKPLAEALQDLNEAIEANDATFVLAQLQRCIDLNVQYFAGFCQALLHELDPESLDVELDSRAEFTEKVEMLAHALSEMESHWEENDGATLLWSAFYDVTLSAGDPEWAYLHTRLLGVEGAPPSGYKELPEFIAQVPGQGELTSQYICRKEVARYLPVLSFWLENATALFLEADVDFVGEDDGKALSWAATLVGETLDGSHSAFWLEVDPERFKVRHPEQTPLTIPEECPEMLETLLLQLNDVLEQGNLDEVTGLTRLALDFLVQYFAGCVGSAWQQEGHLTPQAADMFRGESSLDEKQRLIVLGLGSLGTASAVGRGLGKVFPRTSLHFKQLNPRRSGKGGASVAEFAVADNAVHQEVLFDFLGILRSWLGAMGDWLEAGEQLFEDSTEDGLLEGVVVYKTVYLELVEPEYSLRLKPEFLALLGEEPTETTIEAPEEVEHPEPAPAPAIEKVEVEVFVPEGAPEILEGHLKRLAESLDDRPAACAWIGAAFEYLIQYFAGLTATIGQDSLNLAHKGLLRPDTSLREREKLLVAAIEAVKQDQSSEIRRVLTNVFWDGNQPRLHTRLVGAGTIGQGETLLSYLCRLRHEEEDLTDAQLIRWVPVLNSWTQAAQEYFQDCEHYGEDPGPEGQEEMVVVYGDEYIEMVQPEYCIQVPARGYYEILYRESDEAAEREALSLVSGEAMVPTAEPISPAGEADLMTGPAPGGELLGADIGTPTELLGGALVGVPSDDFFGAPAETSDDDFFGAAQDDGSAEDFFSKSATEAPEKPKPAPKPIPERLSPVSFDPVLPAEEKKQAEPEKPPEKKKKKRSKAGAAVLELYKRERLEKARKRAEARARKASQDPPQMEVSISYRGLKSSPVTGTNSHAGTLELVNTGGGEMKGAVKATHPCVRVQPRAFKGNEARILYFVDPSDMPSSGKAGLVIQTQNQKLELNLDKLVSSSWLSERPTPQAAAILSLPAVASWLIWLLGFVFLVKPQVLRALTKAGGIENLTSTPPVAWVFAVLLFYPAATLVPGIQANLFARFGPEEQTELSPFLPIFMVLPTGFLTTAFFLPWFSASFLESDHLRLLDLGHQFFFFLLFNGVATAYFWASQNGVLERKFPDEGTRGTISVAVGALNLFAVLILVFFFH